MSRNHWYKATNGDIIRFVGGTDSIAQLGTYNSVVKQYLWTPITGWGSTVAVVDSCASTTADNTFYVRANNGTGAIVTYNTTTQTMTYSTHTASIGSLSGDTGPLNIPSIDQTRSRMYHDGTNVYHVNVGFTSDSSYNYTTKATVQIWPASTFGTVASVSKTLPVGMTSSSGSGNFPRGIVNVQIGTSQSGKLLMAIPAWRSDGTIFSSTVQGYVVEYGVSGTTLTLSSTANVTGAMTGLSDTVAYAYQPTSKALYVLAPYKTTPYTTSFGTTAASTLPGPFTAFPTRGTGRTRLVAATRSGYTVSTYSSPDGYTWSNKTDFPRSFSDGTTNIEFYGLDEPRYASASGPSGSTTIAYGQVVWYSLYNYSYSYSYVLCAIQFNVTPVSIQASPISGTQTYDQVNDTIPLVWTHSDPDGTGQVAYEILIAENTIGATQKYLASNGTLNVSQQTVTSGTSRATIAPGVLASSLYGYQWSVRSQDDDSAWSPWTGWSVFKVAGRPTLVVTSPATATSNMPTITFEHRDPDNNALHSYRIVIYTLSGSTVWDGGWAYVGDNAPAYGSTVTTSVGTTLVNGDYLLGISTIDSTGTQSYENMSNLTVVLPSITAPTLSTSVDANGFVTVSSTSTETTFTVASLDRWSDRLNAYVTVATGLDPSFSFVDRFAPTAGSFTYRATYVGSAGSYSYTTSTVTTALNSWRIATMTTAVAIHPDQFTLTTLLADESLEPLGRSKQVRWRLGVHGYGGSLSATLLASERDAIVSGIESMISSGLDIYISNPYGSSYRVSLTPPEVGLEAGGRATISLSFTETGDA